MKYDKKGIHRLFKTEFKKDAVSLVSEQGYSMSEAAGTTTNSLRHWIKDLKHEESGMSLDTDERAELDRLRCEVKQFRIEKYILKMDRPVFAKEIN